MPVDADLLRDNTDPDYQKVWAYIENKSVLEIPDESTAYFQFKKFLDRRTERVVIKAARSVYIDEVRKAVIHNMEVLREVPRWEKWKHRLIMRANADACAGPHDPIFNLSRVSRMLIDRAEKLNNWFYWAREDYFHDKLRLNLDDFTGVWGERIQRTQKHLWRQPEWKSLEKLSAVAREILEYARQQPTRPKYRDLHRQFGHSFTTIRNALLELKEHGLWPLPGHEA